MREAIVDGAGQQVHWVSGSGPGDGKRIRLNRKKLLHTSLGFLFSISSHGFWKEVCNHVGTFPVFSIPDHKRRAWWSECPGGV